MKDHKRIYFLTKNRGKFREALAVAACLDIRLQMLARRKIEIQSDSLREIAAFSAQDAANRLCVAVLAEDAGLFIDALGDFPGPYSSYVFKRIGIGGILTLMNGMSGRNARFRSAVAFCIPHERPKCFEGTVEGTIGLTPQGTGGFGYDPIFIPAKGDGRTFAQMSVIEKNEISHRAISFGKLLGWMSRSKESLC